MNFDLKNKIAVVTGGSRGLGREMVLAFAKAGADVMIASRKLEAGQEVAHEVEKLGRKALPFAAHVGTWEDNDKLADAAKPARLCSIKSSTSISRARSGSLP